MSKIIAPPQINYLNEFLDVLLHPEKYQAYMRHMQDMLQAINERLEHLTTKDEIDQCLLQAQTKQKESSELLARAKADADKMIQSAKSSAQEMLFQVQTKLDQLDQHEKDLVTRSNSVTQREQAVQSLEASVKAREVLVSETTRKQAEKAQELTEKARRLEKLTQTMLAEVGN